jgi:mRNA interferase RelE/StbE
VTFTVKYHPDVRDVDLPLIDRKMRDRIRRAIESRLMTAPHEYGIPLRKNLGGYWKLRVGDYRIVFKIEGEIVYVLAIRHRRNVNEDVKGRIGEATLHGARGHPSSRRRKSSRVIAAVPRPSASPKSAAYRAALRALSSIIFSSTVWRIRSRRTVTRFFCPIRWARSAAWPAFLTAIEQSGVNLAGGGAPGSCWRDFPFPHSTRRPCRSSGTRLRHRIGGGERIPKAPWLLTVVFARIEGAGSGFFSSAA